MNWGCCYVSVNNPQNNANQSFQNAASSYFEDYEINELHADDEGNTFLNKDGDSDAGDFDIPITLEQMDQSLGPNAKMMAKTRNSAMRQSNNSTLKDNKMNIQNPL